MNLNDLWSAFNTIYDRVTRALLISLAAVLGIRFSRRGIGVRRYISRRLSQWAQSKALSDFGRTADLLKAGILAPIGLVHPYRIPRSPRGRKRVVRKSLA